MGGPLRQRRAEQLKPYEGKTVRVFFDGELIVEGVYRHLEGETTDQRRARRDPGHYVSNVPLPLKSIITPRDISWDGSITVDRYLENGNEGER
jgi:hypothetical protein